MAWKLLALAVTVQKLAEDLPDLSHSAHCSITYRYRISGIIMIVRLSMFNFQMYGRTATWTKSRSSMAQGFFDRIGCDLLFRAPSGAGLPGHEHIRLQSKLVVQPSIVLFCFHDHCHILSREAVYRFYQVHTKQAHLQHVRVSSCEFVWLHSFLSIPQLLLQCYAFYLPTCAGKRRCMLQAVE